MAFSISMPAQRRTIYVDEFQSEIPVPQQVISTIRRAFIDGISNTNRVNIIDATAIKSKRAPNPLEDARRFKAEYLLRGNILKREATDDGNNRRRYHSREDSYKEKFTLRLT